MKILNKSLIHDIEIFPNFFSDIFKIPGKNIIFIVFLLDESEWNSTNISPDIIDEIKLEFKEYDVRFRNISEVQKNLKLGKPYLIGYNNYHYDDIIWKYIIKKRGIVTTGELFKLSKSLVEGNTNKLKYDKIIKTIDLMRVSGCDRLFKPLKQTASNLKHELIQDLPKHFNETVEPWEILDILKYELNDVLITEKLLLGIPEYQKSKTIPKTAYKGLLPAIEFRSEIGKKFNIDILNNNKSQIGEKLAATLYSKVSNREYLEFKDTKTERDSIRYEDIIFPIINFKTPQLQQFLKKLKDLVYKPDIDSSTNFTFEFNFYNSHITFAQGGIHGIHSKDKIFEINNNEDIIDLDVGSYYPSLYDLYHIEPEHLPSFNEFVGEIISLRLGYKKEGNKLYANGLKLGINRIFGGFSDKFGWLYDVKALLQTTINGQLMILMLAEELELAGISVFYYNTDGITCICSKDKREVLNSIWKKWEHVTKMNLEENLFSKCYIRDFNNFLNIQLDDKVKSKGAYEYESYIEKYGEFDVTGSFNMPIVAYAVSRYLVNNIPIEKTIKEHRDIYDFCIAKKTGKQFKNELFKFNNGIYTSEIIQQSVRYYISNTGDKLYKVKKKKESELLNLLNKSATSKINEYRRSSKELSYKKIHTFDNGDFLYVIENKSILFSSKFKEWLRYDNVCSGEQITLFNEYFKPSNWEGYNIKYEYYIEEANKLLLALNTNDSKNVPVVQGKLF
jgi:hypothetical protein